MLLAAMSMSLLGGSPARAGGEQRVAVGWNLFETNPDRTQFHPIQGLPLMVNCRGIPVGSYDFGDVGVQATGPTDTIVQRFDEARPDSPVVNIELVALQLQCGLNLPAAGFVELPVFVTLQSDRGAGLLDPPPGQPSTGTLDITFFDDGNGGSAGGTASSRLDVYYDVRIGALNGPIINDPGGPLPIPSEAHFETNNMPWQHAKSTHACLEELDILVSDQHGIITPDWYILAVNYLLNGTDPGADFNYGLLEAFCQERGP